MTTTPPPGFRHWPDPAEDRIGPFFYRLEAPGRVIAHCEVLAHHCNAYGGVHGGVLMTLADYTLCLAAIDSEQDAVVTVSANCDFVSGAKAGEVLAGEGERVRAGGSLVFTRAVIRAGDRVIMTASGVIKRLPKTGT